MKSKKKEKFKTINKKTKNSDKFFQICKFFKKQQSNFWFEKKNESLKKLTKKNLTIVNNFVIFLEKVKTNFRLLKRIFYKFEKKSLKN